MYFVNIAVRWACSISDDGFWTLNVMLFSSGRSFQESLKFLVTNLESLSFWEYCRNRLTVRLWELWWDLCALREVNGESGIWWMCCVIRCSNKVYQCWNHEPQGQLFTASLNTQCHLVSLESHWKYLSLFPSICHSHSPVRRLSVSQTLSLLLFSPSLVFPFSPRCLCFHLSSFFFFFSFLTSSMSLLFMFISLLFVSLFVILPSSVCACRRRRQVVRRGFTRLRETRAEKRVTIHFNLLDMACDILKVDTKGTHSAQFVYSFWLENKSLTNLTTLLRLVSWIWV